ncbi:MAG TPA: aminodeoxychorismate lyase [Gammaproteobacteria bacterium]
MQPSWLVNGAAAAIDPNDRGFAYGDGVFETMAVLAGRIRYFDRHFERLSYGCRRLGIDGPDERTILEDLEAIGSLPQRCVAKLIVTRGAGGRGYRPPRDSKTTRALGIHPWPEYPDTYYSAGVAVRLCETRLPESPRLAGIKHLNRLEHVLARMEWDDDGVAEGLMLDSAQSIVCGTMTNLFLKRGAKLVTPTIRRCGVAGVMRGVVMDLATQSGIEVHDTDVSIPDLYASDEIFLTNAIAGVWPVRRVGERSFDVGMTTRKLMNLLEDSLHA